MDDRIDDLLREEARDYNDPPATPRAEMWERIQMVRRTAGQADPRADEPLVAVPAVRAAPRPARRAAAAPLFRLGIGIAALLALGIGIGRWMERAGSERTPSVAASPAQRAPAEVTDTTSAIPGAATPEAGQELASAPISRRSGGVPVTLASRSDRRSGAGAAAYEMALGQHLGQSEAFLTLFRSSVRSGRMDPVAFATARQLLSTNRLLLDSRAGADPGSRQLLQDLELVLAQIAQLSAAGDSSDVHIVTDDMDRGDVLPRLRTAVPAGI
jgi:hypothetical protein